MIYTFGRFELDEERYEVRRDGAPVSLEPKAYRVLTYLVRHRQRVVPRDELREQFWPGEFVTDSALAHCIARARQAMDDDGIAQRLIKTVHGHGYRFIAAVETGSPDTVTSAVLPAPRHAITDEASLTLETPVPPAPSPQASHRLLEGERKQATVLAAGISGVPALAQAVDLEALPTVLGRLFDLLRAEVQRFGGHVSLTMGNGLQAVFGAPVAYEDHAVRALHAALEVRRAFAAFADDLQRTQGMTLTLRLGLHTGPVIIGAGDDGGWTVDIAQSFTGYVADSLQQLAGAGTVRVSEAVRRQGEGFFWFKDLGGCILPEIAQALHVYECTGVQQGSTRLETSLRRHLSAFRGREQEVEFLKTLWSRASDGQGQVVWLSGEAGIGKSRLAFEFQQTLMEGSTLRVQAFSHGQSMPYHAFIPLLRDLLQVSEHDTPYDQRRQLGSRLHAIHQTLAEGEPLLSHLLGIPMNLPAPSGTSPEDWKRRLQHLCQQVIWQQATVRPRCLLVEDGHWLDTSSHELLDLLAIAIATRPILLLVTARPGFRHTWDDLTYFHRLSVEPLAPTHTDALIRDYFRPHDASRDLKALIRGRTGGNPFFVEEFLRALGDREVLVLRHDGQALKPGTSLNLPASVQGVLAARLDRLPASDKYLLQAAAVIGMEVPFSLLEAIAGKPGDVLDSALLRLQAAEFLHETGSLPDRTLAFKHALTREVVYDSLLRVRRRALHAQILATLEERAADRLDELVDTLAHHAAEAEVWEKAFAYLCKAGDKARRAHATQEALGYYSRAIETSERLTPPPEAAQLLPVYEGRGLVGVLSTNYEAAIADFQRMCELARASGNPQKEGESLGHLAYVRWLTFSEAHIPLIEQHGREALQLARGTGDQQTLARSLIALGSVDQVRGQTREADRKFAEAMHISRREGYQESLAHALVFRCMVTYEQGKFQASMRLGQEGVSIARAIRDGFTELRTLAFLCQACWSAGHYAQALTLLHEGRAKANERQNAFMAGRLTNTLGWFSREFGAVARAIELDHESMELGRASGVSNVEISALINLGLDYLALDQYERALSSLSPTLERVQREAFGVHKWRWQMKLLIGLAEIHYGMGAYEPALRVLEDGLQQAQATGSQKYIAKAWALRGKILIALKQREAGGQELRRAFNLVEQLCSPSLTYQIAYELGHWLDMTGQERQAAALYGRAKTAIERMLATVHDPALQSSFRQYRPVQAVLARAARAGL